MRCREQLATVKGVKRSSSTAGVMCTGSGGGPQSASPVAEEPPPRLAPVGLAAGDVPPVGKKKA